MCHFVKYSRVCDHFSLNTTLCLFLEGTALDPKATGAGADFGHTKFTF